MMFVGHRSGGEREVEVMDDELVEVMARLAAGDGAAIYTLQDRFGGELARQVRVHASRRRARLTADEVSELVIDVALEIAELAGSWKPDGAPPWLWAWSRIGRVVDRHIGQWTDLLDPNEGDNEAEPRPSSGSEPAVLDVLEKLAQLDPRVALFDEAVALIASPRDRELFYEHGLQSSLGDRSPATTVGHLVDMNPAAVRQQNRRIRLRLQRLADTDPRFASLTSSPLVA